MSNDNFKPKAATTKHNREEEKQPPSFARPPTTNVYQSYDSNNPTSYRKQQTFNST